MTEGWTEWGTRLQKRVAAQASKIDNLAEAVKQALGNERKRRADAVDDLHRLIAELQRELAMLKGQIDTAQKLDGIASRLDRVEASRGLGRDLN